MLTPVLSKRDWTSHAYYAYRLCPFSCDCISRDLNRGDKKTNKYGAVGGGGWQKEIDTNALQLKTESHFCIEDHVPGTGGEPPSLSCVLLCSVQSQQSAKPPSQLTVRVIFKWYVSWEVSCCVAFIGHNHTFDTYTIREVMIILNSETEPSPTGVILGNRRVLCSVILQISYFWKINA
jgi:hypothetical protein